MKTSLFRYREKIWTIHPVSQLISAENADLVLCFGACDMLRPEDTFQAVKEKFPLAQIAMCSTSGEILAENVFDNSIVVIAMQFASTKVRTAAVNIQNFKNSYDAAISLTGMLPSQDLAYVMVLSDGSLVNGSELVKGLNSCGSKILTTGGLAGDAANFKSTLVGLNAQPKEGNIVVIGFYGNQLKVTHGSQGGWETFGIEKEITKSVGNILYEIENQNALELYKKYLGPDAENLPAAALLFPLSVMIDGVERPVVRTILSVDETNKTMTFAGDVPQGSRVRFMKANFDKLIAAASTAAAQTMSPMPGKPDFVLLVSCVGRKLILGPRIDEEVEAVIETLGPDIPIAGFYSYGEISPVHEGGSCQLHNQTMTITSFYELS